MINIDNAQNDIGLPGQIDDGREWSDWLLEKAEESNASGKNEMTRRAMINNSLHLTQIIASVWSDPSDITDVVWHSGYRKPEREATEIAQLTIDIMEGVPDEAPHSARPKNLNDILTVELYDIIFAATWINQATPASVARVILKSGYQKGGE